MYYVGLNTIQISPGTAAICLGGTLDLGRDICLEVFCVESWGGKGGKFCSVLCFAPRLFQVLSGPSANQHE